MFLENVADTVLGQNVREREPLVARKAGAHRIQACHGTAYKFSAIPAIE
jgi:hypothetical protein